MEESGSIFGRRLREARQAKGLTQRQLGALVGFDGHGSSARITQYERGRHWPDYPTAQRLAAALDVPTCYLYCDDDAIADRLLEWFSDRQSPGET